MTNYERVFLPSIHKSLAEYDRELVCRVWHKDDHCSEGIVYLAQFGDLIKIGYTRAHKGMASVRGRVSRIGTVTAQPGTLIHTIKADCGAGLERYLHSVFKYRWAGNELFRLTEDEIALIGRLPKFNGKPVEHTSFPLPSPPQSAI